MPINRNIPAEFTPAKAFTQILRDSFINSDRAFEYRRYRDSPSDFKDYKAYKSVSVLKLLNPFNLINMAATAARASLNNLIDRADRKLTGANIRSGSSRFGKVLKVIALVVLAPIELPSALLSAIPNRAYTCSRVRKQYAALREKQEKLQQGEFGIKQSVIDQVRDLIDGYDEIEPEIKELVINDVGHIPEEYSIHQVRRPSVATIDPSRLLSAIGKNFDIGQNTGEINLTIMARLQGEQPDQGEWNTRINTLIKDVISSAYPDFSDEAIKSVFDHSDQWPEINMVLEQADIDPDRMKEIVVESARGFCSNEEKFFQAVGVLEDCDISDKNQLMKGDVVEFADAGTINKNQLHEYLDANGGDLFKELGAIGFEQTDIKKFVTEVVAPGILSQGAGSPPMSNDEVEQSVTDVLAQGLKEKEGHYQLKFAGLHLKEAYDDEHPQREQPAEFNQKHRSRSESFASAIDDISSSSEELVNISRKTASAATSPKGKEEESELSVSVELDESPAGPKK